jgi:hypothetical protein
MAHALLSTQTEQLISSAIDHTRVRQEIAIGVSLRTPSFDARAASKGES